MPRTNRLAFDLTSGSLSRAALIWLQESMQNDVSEPLTVPEVEILIGALDRTEVALYRDRLL